MLVHPQFDPVALQIGPLGIHWYGLTYLVGFALFWGLGWLRAREPWRGITADDLENLLFYGIFGVVLGGRLGYCLFYQPEYYLSHLGDIPKLWQGGMSAHGGMIGVIVVMAIYGRVRGMGFWRVADFVAPLVPLGLMMGRFGNFINGELWGRVCSPSLPWGMIFPQALDGGVPRHPSQLYEAGLEGALLFVVLWLVSRRPTPNGFVAGLFCLGYGLARFTVEFFREPDAFLGLQALGLSRGQWLSLPLILLGIVIMLWATKRKA